MEQTPSLWLLSAYLLLLAVLLWALWALWRWGHIVLYALDYAYIKLRVWWFVRQRYTVVDMFESRARQSPSSTALLFEGRSYSYAQLEQASSLVAYWALQHGLGPHDVVSLMMDNRPEFIITWLGLAKVGVTCALINTNVRGQPLVHSIEQCQPVAFIVGAELLHTVSDVRHQLPPSLRLFSHGKPADGFVELTTELDALAARPLPPSALSFASQRVGLTSSSLLFYIFTSGTTGLPKAARIRHSRFYLGSVSFSTFFHLRASDRLYSALPLYHSVGGILAVGMSWHCGGSLVLRRRFSASAFFQDCYEQDVTVVMYIGQLCKYLMHTPVSAYEERHRVRIAIGNGMPADIWEAFQRRFHIADIGEFYASTEGNANLVNNRNRPGAIGYIPWIATFIYPVRVVAFDYSTEQPVRDPTTGLCREASEGELLGKLSSDPLRAFDGYTSSAATSEKVLTSVFHPHDQWFRTGDLVRRDEEGYIFFVDRIGDTYRWKGENCATTEVERVLSAWPGVKEVNVYGVKVGGHDGKAGMAAIVLHDDTGGDTAAPVTHTAIDLQLFYDFLQTQLPAYQQPLFLRLQKEMVLTATFKLRKVDMVREGFDPMLVSDPLFFRSDVEKTFIPLDQALRSRIISGQIRV